MTIRSFLISIAIGTVVTAFGQANDFNGFEILIMAVAGGVLQGVLTAVIRGLNETNGSN